MEDDGSSIRIKVAQYFVDKKLQQTKELQIDTNKASLEYVQRLPRCRPETQAALANVPLAPLRLTLPDNYASWDQLKELLTPSPGSKAIVPPWYRVAIIGAGIAGLRTAKLLQDQKIPYKIFEASDRPGGRIFTYEFPSSNPEDAGKHDYYDVGAMRFPNNKANEETFKVFEELKLTGKLREYILSTDNNIRYFNNIKATAADVMTAGDHFNDETVPKEFLDKKYTDPWNRELQGVSACTAEAFDPFRQALIADFDQGWQKLMKYDWASVRTYLTVKGLKDAEDPKPPEYPLSVVHWMETRDSGTGYYEEALSDVILSSLEFDDPTKKVEWKYLEGGSKVLVDAMLAELNTQPSYENRVTSVEQVYEAPRAFFPDDCDWLECPVHSHCPRCPFHCSEDKTDPARCTEFTASCPCCPKHCPPFPNGLSFPLMKVSVMGKPTEYFAHVVSTVSFAELGLIDTSKVTMTYKQRQAIRTLRYGPAVKVAIKFKSRWWEKPGINQRGGSSTTDRPCREVVYPSYGIGDSGPGVLMVAYNRQQDGLRFGALIKNPDWSDRPDPKRERPSCEKLLLDQIYEDLAVMHGVGVKQLREDTLDYHAFDWYHNPYTMGAFAHFAPGQYGSFFNAIVHSAGYGRFHFAGEVASHHHGWVSGALDSAKRVAVEIAFLDLPFFKKKFGVSEVFQDETAAEEQCLKGLFSKEFEEAKCLRLGSEFGRAVSFV